MSPEARSLVLPIAAIFALTGCTSPPAAPIEPRPESSAPLPSVPGLQNPLSILPLDCEDLLSTDQASAVVGATVTVSLDERTLPYLSDAALRQVGGVACAWSGESIPDTTGEGLAQEQSLTLAILPNAAADFDAGVTQVHEAAINYPEGEQSSYLCPGEPGRGKCFANLLVRDYWVQLRVESTSTGAAQMRSVIDTVNAAIAVAGEPRPAFVAPDSISGAYCPAPEGEWAMVSDLRYVVSARARIVNCSAGDGWWVSVLPGGAWSLPALDDYAGLPFLYAKRPLDPVLFPGADAALWTQSGDGAIAVVSAGGSALVLMHRGMFGDEFLTAAAAILAAVAAAG